MSDKTRDLLLKLSTTAAYIKRVSKLSNDKKADIVRRLEDAQTAITAREKPGKKASDSIDGAVFSIALDKQTFTESPRDPERIFDDAMRYAEQYITPNADEEVTRVTITTIDNTARLAELKKLQADIKQAKADLATDQVTNARLRGVITSKLTSIASLDAKIALKGAALAQARADFKAEDAKLIKVRQDHANFLTQIAGLNQDLLTLTTEITNLETRKTNLENQAQKQHKEVSDLEQKLRTATAKRIQLKVTKSDLEQKIQHLTVAIKAYERDKAVAEAELKQKTKEFTDLSDDLSVVQTEITTLEDQYVISTRQISDKKKEHNEKTALYQRDILELERQLADAKIDEKAAATKLSDLKLRKENQILHRRNLAVYGTLDRALRKMKKGDAKPEPDLKIDKQRELEKAETEMTAYKKQVFTLAETLAETLAAAKKMAEPLEPEYEINYSDEPEADAPDLSSKLEQLERDYAGKKALLEKQASEYKERTDRQEKLLQEHKQELLDLKEELRERATRNDILADEIERTNKDNVVLRDEIHKLTVNKTLLENKISTLTDTINSLQEDQKGISEGADKYLKKIQELDQKFNERKRELESSYSKKFDQDKADLDKAHSSQLERKDKEHTAAMLSKEAQFAAQLADEVQRIEETKAAEFKLKTDTIDTLRQEKKKIRADLEHITYELRRLGDEKTKQTTDLKSYKKAVEDLTAKLNRRKDRVLDKKQVIREKEKGPPAMVGIIPPAGLIKKPDLRDADLEELKGHLDSGRVKGLTPEDLDELKKVVGGGDHDAPVFVFGLSLFTFGLYLFLIVAVLILCSYLFDLLTNESEPVKVNINNYTYRRNAPTY